MTLCDLGMPGAVLRHAGGGQFVGSRLFSPIGSGRPVGWSAAVTTDRGSARFPAPAATAMGLACHGAPAPPESLRPVLAVTQPRALRPLPGPADEEARGGALRCCRSARNPGPHRE